MCFKLRCIFVSPTLTQLVSLPCSCVHLALIQKLGFSGKLRAACADWNMQLQQLLVVAFRWLAHAMQVKRDVKRQLALCSP